MVAEWYETALTMAFAARNGRVLNDDVEDMRRNVAVDTLMRCVKTHDKRRGSSFGPRLYRMIHWAILDAVKAERVRRRRECDTRTFTDIESDDAR